MSATPAEVQLPDLNTAYGTIVGNVHQRAILHKLAQRGYRAETEQDALELLELTDKVASATQTPQGEPGHSKFAEASHGLDNLLGESQTPAVDQEIKEAALALAADPDTYNSALAIKHAEYQAQVQQQEGGQETAPQPAAV